MKFNKLKYQVFIENIVLMLLFVGGANLFIYFKTSGLDDLSSLLSPINASHNLREIHIEVSILGIFVGSQILGFQKYIAPILQKNLYKWFVQIGWLTVILGIILLNGLLVHFLVLTVKHGVATDTALQLGYEFISSKVYQSFTIYFFIVGFLVSFLRQLRLNFGEAVFFNFLLGKYVHSKEEKRSFFFIDLNNSTYIAEYLGHTKYSRFLNLCFNDILDAIKDHKYDVYQYVGDEIVLTWLPKDDRNGQAIEMFHKIERRLSLGKLNYLDKFGIEPTFKASVNTGFVTVSLVGREKKVLAYHGDVVNTTARLLELCNKYEKSILFTQMYLNSISNSKNFKYEFLVNLKLRGKNQASDVFHVISNVYV